MDMTVPDNDKNHLVLVASPERTTSTGVALFKSARKYRCIIFSNISQMAATKGVITIQLNFGLMLLILNALAISKLRKMPYHTG